MKTNTLISTFLFAVISHTFVLAQENGTGIKIDSTGIKVNGVTVDPSGINVNGNGGVTIDSSGIKISSGNSIVIKGNDITVNGKTITPKNNTSVKGSGVLQTQQRTISDFQTLTSNIPATIILTQGEATSLIIDAEDNLLPIISTATSGDHLTISNTTGFSATQPITIHLTTKTIEKLTVNGSGNLKLLKIDTNDLEINVSGSSRVSGSGKSTNLALNANGSTKLELANLLTSSCTLVFNGASNGNVNVTKSINATLNGASSIRYLGNPSDIKTQVTGASSISKAK